MMLLDELEEDQRYGWKLKNKKVKWQKLQVNIKYKLSIQQRNNEELKKFELREILIKKEKIHSCDNELESFIRETIETDTRLVENLMEYSNRGGYQEELVMGVLNETLETYGFKTDFCVSMQEILKKGNNPVLFKRRRKVKVCFFKR